MPSKKFPNFKRSQKFIKDDAQESAYRAILEGIDSGELLQMNSALFKTYYMSSMISDEGSRLFYVYKALIDKADRLLTFDLFRMASELEIEKYQFNLSFY